jgi:hypothetical protein
VLSEHCRPWGQSRSPRSDGRRIGGQLPLGPDPLGVRASVAPVRMQSWADQGPTPGYSPMGIPVTALIISAAWATAACGERSRVNRPSSITCSCAETNA